jgi:hypothetical protein
MKKILIPFLSIVFLLSISCNHSREREMIIKEILDNPSKLESICNDTIEKGKFLKKYYTKAPKMLIDYLYKIKNHSKIKYHGFTYHHNLFLYTYKIIDLNSRKGFDEGVLVDIAYNNKNWYIYYIRLTQDYFPN